MKVNLSASDVHTTAIRTAGIEQPALSVWGLSMVLIRIVLGALFLWSSVWKLYQPYEFLRNIYNYDLFGATTGTIVAATIPWVELVIGIALILDVMAIGASIISMLLFLSFLLIQIYAFSYDHNISCGCFSANGDVISYQTLLITGSSALGSIILTYYQFYKLTGK